MLNVEMAIKIGIDACIEKLGREFVLANREHASSAYGENEDGVFCFVGVDNRLNPTKNTKQLTLDNESKFPYRVSCNVSLTNGGLHFIECVIPPLH